MPLSALHGLVGTLDPAALELGSEDMGRTIATDSCESVPNHTQVHWVSCVVSCV
jgi:hypothetical protein